MSLSIDYFEPITDQYRAAIRENLHEVAYRIEYCEHPHSLNSDWVPVHPDLSDPWFGGYSPSAKGTLSDEIRKDMYSTVSDLISRKSSTLAEQAFEKLTKDCAFYGFTETPLTLHDVSLALDAGIPADCMYALACDVHAGYPLGTLLRDPDYLSSFS